GRGGGSFSQTMEHRTRFALNQGRAADGRAAVQDPGDGREGDLDASAGLQPDPRYGGEGGRGARQGAAVVEFQGSAADDDGVPGRPASRVAVRAAGPGGGNARNDRQS